MIVWVNFYAFGTITVKLVCGYSIPKYFSVIAGLDYVLGQHQPEIIETKPQISPGRISQDDTYTFSFSPTIWGAI